MRRRGSDPRCWWCHDRIPAETIYRGTATELDLPPGVGVVVCGPSCDNRPEDSTVFVRSAVQV